MPCTGGCIYRKLRVKSKNTFAVRREATWSNESLHLSQSPSRVDSHHLHFDSHSHFFQSSLCPLKGLDLAFSLMNEGQHEHPWWKATGNLGADRTILESCPFLSIWVTLNEISQTNKYLCYTLCLPDAQWASGQGGLWPRELEACFLLQQAPRTGCRLAGWKNLLAKVYFSTRVALPLLKYLGFE